MVSSARDDVTVARLAAGKDGFLGAHHLAAADRLERLILRAQLMPRVTMSYDPTRIGGNKGCGNSVEAASDSAAAARQVLSKLAGTLPPDCWGVLLDVCGLGKGLQQVETERRWPRRSAKLVLRIGLDQVASRFGLSPQASGEAAGALRGWLGERLPLIGENRP
ncbi:hypothetical protein SAMN05428969_0856 [Devosia sp. YR412]|uniref:DUF6456 domain-containing protein n=1 Tax=Devosia sp. YR412 TaxID=1881030 RepID=UPI0008C46EF2|nr:DUF6456 domain-containing protein [Devosia sp. YR412]SEP77646.1 hypothetical protein SAMN05428969_0856 [Devosia sp. YR412]